MSKNLFAKTATAPVATTANTEPFTVKRVGADLVASLLAKPSESTGAGRPASPWVAVLKETPIGEAFIAGKANNPEIDRILINIRNNCKALVAKGEENGGFSPRYIKAVYYRAPLLDENGAEMKDEKGKVKTVGPDEEVVLAVMMAGEGIKRPRKAKEGQETAPAPVAESAPATA